MKTGTPNKGQKDQSIKFPFAIRFQRLQDYFDGCLSDKGIILFEYLIAMGAYWLEKKHTSFYHSKKRLQRKTRISENTIRDLLRDFEDRGFLRIRTKGKAGEQKTYFKLNYAHMADSMGILFGGEDVDHSPEQLARIAERQLVLRQLDAKQKVLIQQKKTVLRA